MVEAEKITLSCPKCGKQQEVLWFRSLAKAYITTGSTGHPSWRRDEREEKVEGVCECGYKFKAKDLDDY